MVVVACFFVRQKAKELDVCACVCVLVEGFAIAQSREPDNPRMLWLPTIYREERVTMVDDSSISTQE